jgi:hypothetical protein
MLVQAFPPGAVAYEQILRMGWDDGVSRARLTVLDVSGSGEKQRRVRVFVAVASSVYGFPIGSEEEVMALPRYREAAPPPGYGDRNIRDTRTLANYLVERAGGDSQSLRDEENGSVSFTVITPPPGSAVPATGSADPAPG